MRKAFGSHLWFRSVDRFAPPDPGYGGGVRSGGAARRGSQTGDADGAEIDGGDDDEQRQGGERQASDVADVFGSFGHVVIPSDLLGCGSPRPVIRGIGKCSPEHPLSPRHDFDLS